MTAQELRISILREAFSGHLTMQQIEDGSAMTLLQSFSKFSKYHIDDFVVTQKEIPYEIPSNWQWIPLLSAFDNLTDSKKKIPQKSYLVKGQLAVIDQGKKLIGGYTNNEDMKFKGQLPVVVFGDHTRCVKFVDFPFAQGADGIKVLQPRKFYYPKAFYYVLQALPFPDLGYRRHFSMFKKFVIPLPPLAEQKRIVDKLEELLPLVDAYGEAEQRLAAYEARFPDALKQSLLQEAVTGRLVPRRAEEGSAETLYEEIRQEKARLVAEKKIKKTKPLPPVTEEEQPFPIPATWKWIRLGNCGNWYSGTTPSRTRPDYYGGSIPWLKTGDLNDGLITNTSEKITELACKETSVHLNPAGAVLIAMYGATIGRLGLLSMESTTNQACCACTTYSGVFNKFLFFFLLAWRPNFIKQGAGGAQPNISKEKIINTPFPLPPLAEQKRIVDKLEELLALAEHIHEARR